MKVAIFGQNYQGNTENIVSEVIKILSENNVEIIIEELFLNSLKGITSNYNTFNNHEQLNDSIDVLISIGGDGTILRAVTFVRDKNIPIVGINTGRLGFLATVQIENINILINKVLKKNINFLKEPY